MMSKQGICIFFSLVLAGIAPAAMVAHWTLDQADSDPNYFDVSGNGHTAYVVGTPSFTTDVEGNANGAVYLDGSGTNGIAAAYNNPSSDPNFTDLTSFNPKETNGEMTLSCWVNYPSNGGGVVMAKRNDWGDMMFQLHVNSNIGLLINYNPNGFVSTTAINFEFDQWHLITLTHSSTNELKIYVDGQHKFTNSNYGLNANLASTFWIGVADGSPSDAFTGSIDDLRVYDTILSEAEIVTLYTDMIPIPVITQNPAKLGLSQADTSAILTCKFSSNGNNQSATWYRQVGDKDTEAGSGDDIALDNVNPGITVTGPILIDDVYISTLSLEGDELVEAYYYCVVNDTAGSSTSLAGLVYIERKIAHWTLDLADYEDYGRSEDPNSPDPNYLDISGEGHDATVLGIPTFVEDLNGDPDKAISLSASIGGQATAGTWNPSYSGSMSLSLWANYSATGGGIVISKRDGWGSDQMMWQLHLETDMGFMKPGAIWGDYASINRYTAGVTNDEWHLVTITHSEDNELKYYVDGDLVDTRNWGFTYGINSQVNIGMENLNQDGTLSGTVFQGMLDDIRFYNYVLEPTEIADIYNEIAAEDKIFCIEPYATVLDVAGASTVVEDITTFVAEPDCQVNIYDFMVMSYGWLTDGLYPN